MTQKNLIIAALCAVCIGLLGFNLGVNGFLIPTGTLKIAVVDGDRLKKESKAFHAVHEMLVAEQNKAREEILPIESKLLKEQEEIRLESKKNPENAKKRNEAFAARVTELEHKMQKKKALLEKQSDFLSETIQEMVFSIINEISAEQNISIVLNKTVDEKRSIFFVEKRMDLTDKVIAELDRNLKRIKLPDIKE